MSRFKKPPAKQSNKKRLLATEPSINFDAKPPIFSLERLQPDNYCFSQMEKDDQAAFGQAIFKRRNISWGELKQQGRHQLGMEKIDKSSIKAPIPKFITEDQETLIVFRFSGLKAMVGYRFKDIFYVLWFDHNFTLYPH